MSTLLIIIGVALIAGAVALVVVLLHHRLRVAPQVPTLPDTTTRAEAKITQLTAAELEERLKVEYSNKIHEAGAQFGDDLKITSSHLNEEVQRMTSKVIEEELGAYQKTLEEVRRVATETMQQIHDAVEGQRVELRIKLEEEMTAERQRLVDQFDARLGDVVGAYVAESLGNGVDLGAQLHYIIQTLETNKDALKKDLLGEA